MAYAGPRIETLDMHETAGGSPPRRLWLAPASFGLHLAGMLALLIVPLLTASVLPEPATGVRAFFVQPNDLTPPPPPPPPAAPAAKALARPATAQADPATFTAPIEVPDEVRPEDTLDLGGIEGGVAGGVEGGVPGGVVGGIVGGLPSGPPPAPAAVTLRVGGNIREPRRVKYVPPVYPELAAKARLQGIVIVEAIIGANGLVRDAKVLRGLPMLDEAALEAVKQWVYTPTLLSGVPVQIALVVTVNFQVKQTAASLTHG
jgi:protein TonB